MKGYKELIVWRKSMELVKEVYRLVALLPETERYALADQMRRSAVSIPSNIAEGQGRLTNKDFAHFLSVARGSKAELETQIYIAESLHYIRPEQSRKALCLCSEVGKMLNNLVKTLLTTND